MMLCTMAKLSMLAASLLLQPLVSSTQIQKTLENPTQAFSGATGFPPCDDLISAGLGDRILLATSDEYEPRVQSWWSANGRLRPWCFVQPQTTQEVSLTVSTLAESGLGAGDWHIAVRSGGHMAPGTNNIADGVTIDLGMMNSSSYDQTSGLASVQPGAAWKDVYYNLLQTANITVTGGRDGGVGVGGFLLGGGNSYYTGRNGFGCDNVVNYEVVLANGSIISVNANENPAMWRALKGGSLNFGIVTRFDLQTMPAIDLAYGQSIINSSYSDQVLDAVVQFTNHMEQRKDDHLITLYTHDTDISENTTIIAIRVNTKANLSTTSFDEITKIPALESNWGLQTLADAANASQIQGGTKNVGTTLTFLNNPSILQHSAMLHTQLVTNLSRIIGAENFTTQVFFQPLPKYLSTLGLNNNTSGSGNMLNLENLPGNAILWAGGVAIKNGDDNAVALAQAGVNSMTAALQAFAVANGMATDLVYLNYADPSQNPLGSYGQENVQFMKEVAEQYDPSGFWQERVPGGFKVSRVGG